jgi:hypothetical protein
MNVGELKDYYGMLEVPQGATVSEIHKAYWQKASRCHPDKGGSHDAMVQLVEAWKILSDPAKRARYDQLLKYRHNGWQNRKFNEDVQDARKRAAGYAASSWAEFEEVYQKAFYTFNRDFYGEDINGKAAGPYSPLMGTKITGARSEDTAKSKPAGGISISRGSTMSVCIVKAAILSVAIVAALFMYRNFSGIGRYVPLVQQDTSSQLMLDTTNGAVYSVEKRNGTISSPWKVTVPPFPREKK